MPRSRSARSEDKRREKAVETSRAEASMQNPAARSNRSFVRWSIGAASSAGRSHRHPKRRAAFIFFLQMSKEPRRARMQTSIDVLPDAQSTAADTAIYLLFICWLSQSGRDCIDKSRPHVLQRMSRTSRHISIGSPAVDSCATKGRGGLAGNPLPEFIKLSARLWHVSDCVYRSAAWGDDDEVGYCDGVGSGVSECQL